MTRYRLCLPGWVGALASTLRSPSFSKLLPFLIFKWCQEPRSLPTSGIYTGPSLRVSELYSALEACHRLKSVYRFIYTGANDRYPRVPRYRHRRAF